jgi:hypothetical protein
MHENEKKKGAAEKMVQGAHSEEAGQESWLPFGDLEDDSSDEELQVDLPGYHKRGNVLFNHFAYFFTRTHLQF